MGVSIFSDCIFFLKVNSLSLKEKKKLKNTITLNGGEISFVLSEKCTHAVVSNPATLNSTQQKKIEKHAISVVNPDFIWKSVQKEQLEVDCEEDNDRPPVIVEKDQDEKKNLFLANFFKKKETVESSLDGDVEFEDFEEVDNTSENSEVAKYCCFQKDEEYAIVELLCFTGQGHLPFRISTVYGLPNTSQKEFTFNLVETAEKACEKYEHRINEVKNKGFTQINKIPLQAENFASKALQKVLLGEAIDVTELSPEVAGLVESFWVDAVGHLDSILSCPVENISLNDLSKAEGILCQTRKALINRDRGNISELMQEFYRFIPHKEKTQRNINMKFLTAKQDLCQVIRDMINVCETSVSRYSSTSTAKYQALRCRIEHINPNSAEFLQVKQSLLDHNHSNREFEILRVFRVGRLSEVTNFKNDLGNVHSLLHASSPCNFVGILSRGLMLPKIIVEEFGGERTDIGNLGSGIYFSDSISTSIKYSQPSSVTGSRLLVVCEVALGKCQDVFHRDYTMTEPPNGFHSVHGVRHKDGVNSDFSDDEYVVYDLNQVQMRYIVQFSTDGDDIDLHKESLFISIDETLDHRNSQPEPSEDVSLDLPEQPVTKAGLEGSDGQQIPLQSIHVKARLMDLAAKVVMFQTYKNDSTFPIEAKYVFPLDSTAAVCGFEAFINGKHIIGEVKEKQQAHREYRTAISEGHGAYLMDQDAPDVFTVSVGNLPPKATVIIKITYVMELQSHYTYIDFKIPGNVAQWHQEKALKENTQDTVTKVGIESDMAPEGSFSLDMSIEMPRELEMISCYTHKIKIKKTKCKAVIQTEESSSFNEEGLSISIFMESVYIPRMWVEKHPDKDSEACMLIFQPEFDQPYEEIYMTICLDCSNSMESCFQSAKQVALLALHSIHGKYMNIVLFGSNYKEFYLCPKFYQCDDYDVNMERFIKEAKPNMGNTEFWKVLQSLCLLRTKSGRHKVLLISDGHVQNENLVFQILNKNKNHIQLFTCGVGTTANKHMLRCIAQYGDGAFEYFADKSKSKWKDQMEKHRTRLVSPTCTSVSVKWRQYNQNSSEILQAPANIQALFNDDNLLVYGFISHCTQATLKAFFNDKELENMVSTTELQKTTGTILHTLTARALIRDHEEGILHEKENENEMKKQEMKSCIIQLSKEYSLVTQFTSFVAVEKRSAEEDIDVEPNVLEIISAEDVDILPYMDWSAPDDKEPTASEESDAEGSEELADQSQQLNLDELCAKYESSSDLLGVFDIGEMDSEENYAEMSRVASKSERVPQGKTSSDLRSLLLLSDDDDEDMESKPAASPGRPVMASRSFSQMALFSRMEERADILPESWGRAAEEAAPDMTSSSMFIPSCIGPPPIPPRRPVCGSPAPALSLAPAGSQASLERDRASSTEMPVMASRRRSNMVGLSRSINYRANISPESWGRAAVMASFSRVIDAPPPPPVPIFGSPASAAALNASESNLDSSPGMPVMTPRRRGYSSEVSSSRTILPESRGFAPVPQQACMDLPSPVIHRFPGAAAAPPPPPLPPSFIGAPPPPPPPVPIFGSPASAAALNASESNLASSPGMPVMTPRRRGYSSAAFSGHIFDCADIFPESRGFAPVPQQACMALPSPVIHRFPGAAAPPPPPIVASPTRAELLASESKPASSPGMTLDQSVSKLVVLSGRSMGDRADIFPESWGRAAGPPTAVTAASSALIHRHGVPPQVNPLAWVASESLRYNMTLQRSSKPEFPKEGSSSSLFGSAVVPDRLTQTTGRTFAFEKQKKRKKLAQTWYQRRHLEPPSWSSLSSLQSPEGFWLLNLELGTLLQINVHYLTEDLLVKKGIKSLGARGVDTIHKLIATLLVLQIIRFHNILSEITFKTLMKLDPSVPKSLPYLSIEKAIEWAGKADRQYSGICMRLGLGKDWEQATRQLLGLDPISTTSDNFLVSDSLFLM